MTKPLTPKQEAFALAYVETGNASEAYRRSYDVSEPTADWVKVEACNLLSDPNVAITVQAIRESARERTIVTIESITRELEEVRKAAFSAADFGPANTAIMGKAKVNGLITDKIGGDPKAPVHIVSTIERRIVRPHTGD